MKLMKEQLRKLVNASQPIQAQNVQNGCKWRDSWVDVCSPQEPAYNTNSVRVAVDIDKNLYELNANVRDLKVVPSDFRTLNYHHL